MKGILALLVILGILIFFLFPIYQEANRRVKVEPSAVKVASPEPSPEIISESTAAPSATPAPTPSFPDPKYWPTKCHLLKPTVMASPNATVTVPAMTEAVSTLSEDHRSITAKIIDPPLAATVPLDQTDFLELSQKIEKRKKNLSILQAQQQEAQAKAEKEFDDAARASQAEHAWVTVPFVPVKIEKVIGTNALAEEMTAYEVGGSDVRRGMYTVRYGAQWVYEPTGRHIYLEGVSNVAQGDQISVQTQENGFWEKDGSKLRKWKVHQVHQ